MRGEKLLQPAANDVVIVSNYDAQRHCVAEKSLPPSNFRLDLTNLRYDWSRTPTLTYLFPCILSTAGPNTDAL
jgi:hypothetical protein